MVEEEVAPKPTVVLEQDEPQLCAEEPSQGETEKEVTTDSVTSGAAATGKGESAQTSQTGHCADESISAEEHMHAFLLHGKVPSLGHVRGIPCPACGAAATGVKAAKLKHATKLHRVSHSLVAEAKRVLDRVVDKWGNITAYVEAAFGPPIPLPEAHSFLEGYLRSHGIAGKLAVKWDPHLNVGGRVFVSLHSKHPEKRRFTLRVYDPTGAAPLPTAAASASSGDAPGDAPADSPVGSPAVETQCEGASEQPAGGDVCLPDRPGVEEAASSNPAAAPPRQGGATTVLRKQGIVAFADHELGCHLVRSLNDGHQVWAGRRHSFGLQDDARAAVRTEEGLASLHSALASAHPSLFFTALLYYAAACADTMSFTQLFAHLEPYVPDPGARYRQVARAKYGLCDPERAGGNGKSQCYFEGNVAILRCLPGLDIRLLFCGKITLADLLNPRIRRLARTESLSIPSFARDAKAFKRRLRQLGVSAGILQPRTRASTPIQARAASAAGGGATPLLPALPPGLVSPIRPTAVKSARPATAGAIRSGRGGSRSARLTLPQLGPSTTPAPSPLRLLTPVRTVTLELPEGGTRSAGGDHTVGVRGVVSGRWKLHFGGEAGGEEEGVDVAQKCTPKSVEAPPLAADQAMSANIRKSDMREKVG